MKKAVHIGSQALDVHTNTQADIDAIVLALVTAIPNLTHIVISTYFDYDSTSGNDQFVKWATAIHKVGKIMWIRSGGFNDWQGTNAVTQYALSDFATNHRTKLITWINNNFANFKAGDILEPMPDEPENNTMWNTTYTTIGSGAGRTAYNAFILGCISDANTRLAANGVSGVITNYCHTNPSATKDVIDLATAQALVADGTDDYPENGSTTPTTIQTSMVSEINTWLIPAHSNSIQKHVTFGPSVYSQLSQDDQSQALFLEYVAMVEMLSLDGLTIYQFGNTSNTPLSRLFDWNGSIWVARDAAKMVNRLFTNHFAPGNMGSFVSVGNGMGRSERAS